MDQAMTQEQRVSLIRYLQAKQEETEMVFTMSGGIPLYPEIAMEIHKAHDTKPKDLLLKEFWIHNAVGCHAGILYFSLRPDGDVYPCTFLPIKAGNIREQSLTDIWRNSKILNTLKATKRVERKMRSLRIQRNMRRMQRQSLCLHRRLFGNRPCLLARPDGGRECLPE